MTFICLISITRTPVMSSFSFSIWKPLIHLINIYCRPMLGSKDPELNILDTAILSWAHKSKIEIVQEALIQTIIYFSPLPPTEPSHIFLHPFHQESVHSQNNQQVQIRVLSYSSGVFQQRSKVWGLLIYVSVTRGWRMSQFTWHAENIPGPKCCRLVPRAPRFQERFGPHWD